MSVRPALPKTGIAAVADCPGARHVFKQVPIAQELKAGDVLVRIRYSGVCHSDLVINNSDRAQFPVTEGHEGCGYIVAIGEGTTVDFKIGDAVGIKWVFDACTSCENCMRGNDLQCLKGSKTSGIDVPGTFQEYVVAPARYVTPIPKDVPLDLAAPILCAGVTVYRALKNCQAYPNDYVAIPGAGGGLGHLAVQYAIAQGYRVIAIDTGEEKKRLCESYGATWVDFKETEDVVQAVKDVSDGIGVHCAVVPSPSLKAYEQALSYLRPTGTLALVGLTPGDLKVSIVATISNHIKVVGSSVGSRLDAIEALKFVQAKRVKPIIALEPLENLDDIFSRLKQGKISGRIVLDMGWKE